MAGIGGMGGGGGRGGGRGGGLLLQQEGGPSENEVYIENECNEALKSGGAGEQNTDCIITHPDGSNHFAPRGPAKQLGTNNAATTSEQGHERLHKRHGLVN